MSDNQPTEKIPDDVREAVKAEILAEQQAVLDASEADELPGSDDSPANKRIRQLVEQKKQAEKVATDTAALNVTLEAKVRKLITDHELALTTAKADKLAEAGEYKKLWEGSKTDIATARTKTEAMDMELQRVKSAYEAGVPYRLVDLVKGDSVPAIQQSILQVQELYAELKAEAAPYASQTKSIVSSNGKPAPKVRVVTASI